MSAPVHAIPDTTAIEASILALTASRGPEKSICPSEVARALHGGGEPGWQSLLTPVRQAASRLAVAGRIEILRNGRAVPPTGFKGVIRLRTLARDPG